MVLTLPTNYKYTKRPEVPLSTITSHQARQLDSVRGFSSLIVLIGHANQVFVTPIQSGHSVFVGFFTQFAVMVFFSLSGFLIGTSIFRNIHRNQQFRVDQYAYDRALRIYPPLMAATLLMIILWKLAPYAFPSGTSLFAEASNELARTGIVTSTKEIVGSLFFLNGFKTATPGPNGPLWSLSYEIWYYVFAGLVFMIPHRKTLAILLLVVAIYLTHKNHHFIMLSTVWIAGLALAKYHQAGQLPSAKTLRVAAAVFGAAAIVAIVGVLQLSPGHSVWLTPLNYFMVASGMWFTAILAMVIQGTVSLPTFFHKSAAYSYTLYIVHFPLMLMIFGVLQATILESLSVAVFVALITVLACVGIAMILAQYFENKELLEKYLRQSQLRIAK
jgi:peptidoglycan/LPS O-acetylase OafA/YrhL